MAALDHLSGQQFFHGTVSNLSVGDTLHPGVKVGITRYEHLQPSVYLTPDLKVAGDYAEMAAERHGGTPRVYEVHPHTPPRYESDDEWTTSAGSIRRILNRDEWSR